MNKKKVAIIFTGGTISMTVDEKVGAAIPTLSGEQIMSMVTNIDKVADIEVCNFAEIPGPHMTPERLIELKHYVNNLLEREDICGAVITHGTDSLEETAYFLDLTISSQKPVIVTGAMRADGGSVRAASPPWTSPRKRRRRRPMLVWLRRSPPRNLPPQVPKTLRKPRKPRNPRLRLPHLNRQWQLNQLRSGQP